MGGEDESCAEVPVQSLHELEHDLGGFGVEIPCGLVGEDQWGVTDDRTGKGDPLLISAGQLGREMVLPGGESEILQKRMRFTARRFPI